MSVETRPFAGSWKLSNKKVVQWTPDALVYINGDLTIPGCARCNGRIDLQRFITQIGVEAGTEPNSASATVSLSIPIHTSHSILRDARSVLRPGLEVQVYYRGYFPVKGLYSNIDNPANSKQFEVQDTSFAPTVFGATPKGDFSELKDLKLQDINKEPITDWLKNKQATAASPMWNDSWDSETKANVLKVGASLMTIEKLWGEGTVKVNNIYESRENKNSLHNRGMAADYTVIVGGKEKSPIEVYAGTQALRQSGALPLGGSGVYTNQEGDRSSNNHIDLGDDKQWWRVNGDKNTAASLKVLKASRPDLVESFGKNGVGVEGIPPTAGVPSMLDILKPQGIELPQAENQGPATLNSVSLVSQTASSGYDLENVLAHPYYPVFHGVVTNVRFSYGSGVLTCNLNCESLLHFWQFQQMSANGAVFGKRPDNSLVKPSDVGNNFTNMHPYEIMYGLYRDIAGAAAGVGWALAQKTNIDYQTATGEDLYTKAIQYWHERFGSRMQKLRMHAFSGEVFNTAQAIWLSKLSSDELTEFLRKRFGGSKNKQLRILNEAKTLFPNMDVFDAIPTKQEGTASGTEINVGEMQAFTLNIGAIGDYQLFESTYESKMDIAVKVAEVTGFEFYQDVDGDLVFKPPMYNMDTSASRVYRIEDIDIISINFDEKEPVCTYMRGKGSVFPNVQVDGLENEMAPQAMYIDYRKVAQFGYRPQDFEVSYVANPQALFQMAMARLDLMNVACQAGSVVIPLRPEIRPGYPVYIPFLDCFYYCNGVSHSFSFGGSCTTTLELVARRAKFYAPGHPNKKGIDAIDLSNMLLPPKPLEVLDRGKPKLSGFPNVVMAYDKNAKNPLKALNTMVSDVSGLLEVAVGLGVVSKVSDDKKTPSGLYKMSATESEDIYFSFGGSSKPPSGKKVIDLKGAEKEISVKATEYTKQKDALKKSLSALNPEIVKVQSRNDGVDKGSSAYKANADAVITLKNQQSKIAADIKSLDVAYLQDLQNSSERTGLSELVAAVKKVADTLIRDITGKEGDVVMEDYANTTRALDLLADKKALYRNSTDGGNYRYYSASHPDATQQGDDSRKPEGSSSVQQYAKTPSYSEGSQPEAELTTAIPIKGISVGTAQHPNGECLDTSRIYDVRFSQIQNKYKAAVLDKKKVEGVSVGKEVEENFKKTISNQLQNAGKTQNIQEAMAPWVNQLAAAFRSIDARVKAQGITAQPLTAPVLPAGVMVQGGSILIIWRFQDLKLSDNPDGLFTYPGSTQKTVKDTWKLVGDSLGSHFFKASSAAYKVWVENAKDLGAANQTVMQNIFWRTFLANSTEGSTGFRKTTTKITLEDTPIFPVSDALGYEVFGAYRYGRGISTEANGVFDILHSTDPYSMLSPDLVEIILDTVIRKKDTVKIPISTGYNKTEMKAVSRDKALAFANAEALKTWTAQGITNQNLLNMSAAVDGDNGQLKVDFANLFMQKRDQKISLNNAAMSLSDLNMSKPGLCNCRIAEAGVLMATALTEEYVGITEGPANPVVGWLKEEMLNRSIPWKQAQDGMRGQTSKKYGSVVTAVQSAIDSFGPNGLPKDVNAGVSRIQQSAEDIRGQGKNLIDQADRLGEA